MRLRLALGTGDIAADEDREGAPATVAPLPQTVAEDLDVTFVEPDPAS